MDKESRRFSDVNIRVIAETSKRQRSYTFGRKQRSAGTDKTKNSIFSKGHFKLLNLK